MATHTMVGQSFRAGFHKFHDNTQKEMFVLSIFLNVCMWSNHFLNGMTARTTLRLWHELYTSRGTTHDFTHLLAPNVGSCFVAAERHHIIHAIVVCDRTPFNDLRVLGVAFHPNHVYSKDQFDRLRNLKWEDLRSKQPRIYLENTLHQ